MKTFFGVALSALVLLAPVVSEAASVPQTASVPQSAVFASGYDAQHPNAYLDYQNGIHLMPISPVARGAAGVPLQNSADALMNRTGGER